jgi:hypothetical protein
MSSFPRDQRPATSARFFRPRIIGRVFHCHLCPGRFAGDEGVSLLRWLLIFFFCTRCWTERRAQCESLMAEACALPTREASPVPAGPSTTATDSTSTVAHAGATSGEQAPAPGADGLMGPSAPALSPKPYALSPRTERSEVRP